MLSASAMGLRRGGEGLGLQIGLIVLGYRQRVESPEDVLPADLARDGVCTAEAESAV
jgi:hypothetical protein